MWITYFTGGLRDAVLDVLGETDAECEQHREDNAQLMGAHLSSLGSRMIWPSLIREERTWMEADKLLPLRASCEVYSWREAGNG